MSPLTHLEELFQDSKEKVLIERALRALNICVHINYCYTWDHDQFYSKYEKTDIL